jgi:putative heme iron utilization protein
MSAPSVTVLPGLMPDRLPEGAQNAAGFDPRAVGKRLLRATRAGTLGTLDRNTGHPFASLVTVATDMDGSPVILTSRLSTHTANLEHDARASILLAETGKGDPLAHPRLTVLGTFAPIARDSEDDVRVRRRFLARHPKAELYAGFGDFAFWRMTVASAHLNGGFARAADLKAADILTDLAGADELIAAEAGAVAHMNEDHTEATALYATKLLGEQDGPWHISGIDPDGVDLAAGDRTARLPFAERVTSAGPMRMALVAFAKEARAK